MVDDSEDTSGPVPRPEGGYTVTSPLLPELITEGDTAAAALANAEDAFAAVVEIYEDRGDALPSGIHMDDADGPVLQPVLRDGERSNRIEGLGHERQVVASDPVDGNPVADR